MNDFFKAIEYYKKALEIDPKDQDAKFNLEMARKKMKQNMKPQQQQDQKDQNDRQNQKQGQKQPQPGEKGDDKKNGKSKGGGGSKGNKMSKDDAKRLLDALKDDENKTQKKLKKVQGGGRHVEKDW